ncbi:MAG: hypothetical protein A2V86_08170 [Deltaproteobacteria bacterium RBG_16_49_23]|nr:MAG: hypothetical protein A2V86_08170 [Deltaproteobacteria bacterium RBG_16_49_23]
MSEREKKVEEAGLAIQLFNYLDASIIFLIMFYHRKETKSGCPGENLPYYWLEEGFSGRKLAKSLAQFT